MSNSTSSIDTDRLVLRQPVLRDYEAIARLLGDPEVMRFLALDGRPLTRFTAWQAFAGQVGHWHLRGFGMFNVFERATGEFVGRVGPWRPEGWPGLEVGWSLLSSFWGRGYATEAAAASIDYAFDVLEQPEVMSLIAPENLRSVAVATRLGQELIGETTLPHLPPERMVDVYSVTRKRWKRRAVR
jgi:RimJ/RimL family protein N-acetyltransferase